MTQRLSYVEWYDSHLESDGLYLFNGTDGAEDHRASQAFVEAIREEIRQGYGYLPFVGAGFSVTAGIPIIQQLTNYLQRCICVAVGAEDPDAALWNPRTDRWPPFIDRVRTRSSESWLHLMRAKYDAEARKARKQKNADLALYLEAYGAMAEWRTALSFLSRIILRPERGRGKVKPRPCLGAPQPEVVDACFREVMLHKRPTLNHRMLASLSALLRIDLILTTNFDNLIEQAFEETRSPLEVFDVHIGDKLPEITAVSSVRSIVKMHGSQRSLRADYSLDNAPNHEDKKAICEYLADQKMWDDHCAKTNKKHLILMGIGASERRTLEFVSYAFNLLDDLKIFWVCYSSNESRKIREYIESANLRPKRDRSNRCMFYILRHTDAGLLLLHLYQSIRKSLPSTGGIFPSTTRLSFPPLPWKAHCLKGDDAVTYERFEDDLASAINPKRRGSRKLIVVAGSSATHSIALAAAEAYRKYERDNICLWLDLDDIHSADGVFEAFQEAAYQRLGESDWTPLYVQKDEGPLGAVMPLKAEIRRIVESSNRPWILFLDARETPGSNRNDSVHPNGWMDEDLRQGDGADTANTAATLRLLAQFVHANDDDQRDERDPFTKRREKAASKGVLLEAERDTREIKVVVLCTSGESNFLRELSFDQGTKTGNSGPQKSAQDELKKEDYEILQPEQLPKGPSPDEVANKVLEWVEDHRGDDPMRKDRQRFVQAIVSMQRPRHFAFAWAKCMNQHWSITSDSDAKRNQWLNELEDLGLLHRLGGGFIWLHSRCRQGLRRCLALTDSDLATIEQIRQKSRLNINENGRKVLQAWGATAHQAATHLSLSTWYRKVFDATGAVGAVFDASDHLCLSAESLIRYESLVPQNEHGEVFIHEPERVQLATERVAAAKELLREHQFLIQTHGHPRASLRRLEFLRDFWVVKRSSSADAIAAVLGRGEQWVPLRREIAKLQVTAVEVTCALCREIGEDRDAFGRLREVAIRMSHDDPLTGDEVQQIYATCIRRGERLSTRVGELLGASNLSYQGEDSTDRAERIHRWVRWWRRCGELGVASRSLNKASKSYLRALLVAKKPARLYQPDVSALEDFELKGWVLDRRESSKFHFETLHSLEQGAYCLFLQAHTVNRKIALLRNQLSKGEVQTEQGEIPRLLTKAHEMSVKGLEFVEQIQTSGRPSVDHDFELLRCKARLLMVAALASMREPWKKQMSRHSMSLLADAAACLTNATPDRWRSDLAFVDLRRAEIRLQEAADVKLYSKFPFEAWTYDRLFGSSINRRVLIQKTDGSIYKKMPSPKKVVMDLKHELTHVKENHEDWRAELQFALRTVKARAMDAMRYLDRAEPILRERRRNVWWTTWYFERRLRAISLILWSSIVDENEPIPFLGLEAVMRLSDSEPDILLLNTMRMLRADSYRMAMVTLTYASCARALQIRLRLDQERKAVVKLPERLSTMRGNLEKARTQLANVSALRTSETLPPNAAVAPIVRDVVEGVLDRVTNVLDGLPKRTSRTRAGID